MLFQKIPDIYPFGMDKNSKNLGFSVCFWKWDDFFEGFHMEFRNGFNFFHRLLKMLIRVYKLFFKISAKDGSDFVSKNQKYLYTVYM